jgi:hypothetical protein
VSALVLVDWWWWLALAWAAAGLVSFVVFISIALVDRFGPRRLVFKPRPRLTDADLLDDLAPKPDRGEREDAERSDDAA